MDSLTKNELKKVVHANCAELKGECGLSSASTDSGIVDDIQLHLDKKHITSSLTDDDMYLKDNEEMTNIQNGNPVFKVKCFDDCVTKHGYDKDDKLYASVFVRMGNGNIADIERKCFETKLKCSMSCAKKKCSQERDTNDSNDTRLNDNQGQVKINELQMKKEHTMCANIADMSNGTDCISESKSSFKSHIGETNKHDVQTAKKAHPKYDDIIKNQPIVVITKLKGHDFSHAQCKENLDDNINSNTLIKGHNNNDKPCTDRFHSNPHRKVHNRKRCACGSFIENSRYCEHCLLSTRPMKMSFFEGDELNQGSQDCEYCTQCNQIYQIIYGSGHTCAPVSVARQKRCCDCNHFIGAGDQCYNCTKKITFIIKKPMAKLSNDYRRNRHTSAYYKKRHIAAILSKFSHLIKPLSISIGPKVCPEEYNSIRSSVRLRPIIVNKPSSNINVYDWGEDAKRQTTYATPQMWQNTNPPMDTCDIDSLLHGLASVVKDVHQPSSAGPDPHSIVIDDSGSEATEPAIEHVTVDKSHLVESESRTCAMNKEQPLAERMHPWDTSSLASAFACNTRHNPPETTLSNNKIDPSKIILIVPLNENDEQIKPTKLSTEPRPCVRATQVTLPPSRPQTVTSSRNGSISSIISSNIPRGDSNKSLKPPAPKAYVPGPAYCLICKEKFLNQRDRDKHFRSIHGEAKMPLHCRICKRGYFESAVLMKHMQLKHRMCTIAETAISSKTCSD